MTRTEWSACSRLSVADGRLDSDRSGILALLRKNSRIREIQSCIRRLRLKTKDGAIIYYEDHGSGQPILLVHGWTCSSKFWRKNVPELCKHFRVITIDLRGHGNSSKILTGHTISQYASDVRALIEHLGINDVTLVGWSLGGPVVLSYYDQFRDDSRLKALGIGQHRSLSVQPCRLEPPWAEELQLTRRHECRV